jgi:hypothetical protein
VTPERAANAMLNIPGRVVTDAEQFGRLWPNCLGIRRRGEEHAASYLAADLTFPHPFDVDPD